MIIWAVSTLVVLLIGFSTVLDIVEITDARELYSYVPLVPLVSVYCAWLGRSGSQENPDRKSRSLVRSPRLLPVVLVGLGLWAWGSFSATPFRVSRLIDIHLMVATIGLVIALAGVAGVTLGGKTLRRQWFPFAYLLFAAPMPDLWVERIVDWLMWRSADCVEGLHQLFSQIYFREGTTFVTPALPFTVAPECSGIDSTYALLMTAGLASFLFVSNPASRVIILLSVLPIAILRNGLRIFTISMVCNYVDPAAIDGAIHKQGGKPFFALSLIPLFLIVWLLKKLESRKKRDRATETTSM